MGVNKNGVMWKRGGIRKAWKCRYFVLAAGELKYYVAENGKQSKGVISTSLIQAVQRSNNPKIKCKHPGDVIEIVTPVRIFYLVCKTEDTDEWISAIQSWIGDKTNSKVQSLDSIPGGLSVRGGTFICNECKNTYPTQADLDQHCERRKHDAMKGALDIAGAPAKEQASSSTTAPAAAAAAAATTTTAAATPAVAAAPADTTSASTVAAATTSNDAATTPPAAPSSTTTPATTTTAAASDATTASNTTPVVAVSEPSGTAPATDSAVAQSKAPPPTPSKSEAAAASLAVPSADDGAPAGSGKAASPRPKSPRRSPRVSGGLAAVAEAARSENVSAALAAVAVSLPDAVEYVEVALEAIKEFVAKTGFQVLPFQEVFGRFKELPKTNGSIDRIAFAQLVKGMFGEDQQELIYAIFDYSDLDDSGYLDAGEALCAVNLFCSGSAAERLEVCFEAFDDDNSGTLDRKEFVEMMTATLSRSRCLLEELLGNFFPEDMDVEDATLIQLRKVNEYDVDALANAAFDDADEDNSNSISREEFSLWAAKSSVFNEFLDTHRRVFDAEMFLALQHRANQVDLDDLVCVARVGIEQFVEQTGFKALPFADLVARMRTLLQSTPTVTQQLFCELLGDSFAKDQTEFLHALFDYMDFDDSGDLDAGELLCTLNIFAYGSMDEKLHLCFEAFDDDNSGELDQEEFRTMFTTTLCTSRAVFEEIVGAFTPEETDWESCDKLFLMSLNEYDVAQMADNAFIDADADNSGTIAYNELQAFATSCPPMLDFFRTHALAFGEHPDDDAGLSADSFVVEVAKESIENFRTKTSFQPLPFSQLFATFQTLDRDGDGCIGNEAFRKLVSPMFATDQTELIDAIFDYMDLDDSKSLDASEVSVALNLFASGSTDEKLKICFQSFDVDSSNSLDKDEFVNMVVCALSKSRNLLEELMGNFFPEDMSNENAQMIRLTKINEYESASLGVDAFEECDADSSGSVSFEEFQNWANSHHVFANYLATHEKLFGESN